MEKLRVNLGENSYDISFNSDFSKLCDALKQINAPQKLLVVTDTNVLGLYCDEVVTILKENGYDVVSFAFAAGEENKGMDTILSICSAMMEHKMDRSSMVIALGGGVVGDMAGFASAIYMRGIRFIQIPTTLLSQSDSSVGGKTGIDFCGAKNILGAFLQPKHVYINVNTLKSLPEKEFVSGMGEVIKHGIIRDEKFFCWLSQNRRDIKSLRDDLLIEMCKNNCRIKAGVVEKDEKESGERAHLNFGHTIGHAIESASGFTRTHGECVGLGMVAAAFIAKERGLITESELKSIENILTDYGFSIREKLPDRDEIMRLMRSDKKSVGGTVKFVLPVSIGKVEIFKDVDDEEIINAISYIEKQ